MGISKELRQDVTVLEGNVDPYFVIIASSSTTNSSLFVFSGNFLEDIFLAKG